MIIALRHFTSECFKPPSNVNGGIRLVIFDFIFISSWEIERQKGTLIITFDRS